MPRAHMLMDFPKNVKKLIQTATREFESDSSRKVNATNLSLKEGLNKNKVGWYIW